MTIFFACLLMSGCTAYPRDYYYYDDPYYYGYYYYPYVYRHPGYYRYNTRKPVPVHPRKQHYVPRGNHGRPSRR